MQSIEALLEEHGSLRDIFVQSFEQSYSPIVITDAQLENPGPRILYINAAFTQMTGYSREEIIGQTPRILQGERTDRTTLDRLKTTIAKGEFFQGKAINYHKNGSEYFVEWNISPIKDTQGCITHYISMQQNISAQVRLEEERERHLISQARLAAVGEIMDVTMHQWQQPLSAIYMAAGSIQMAQESPDEKTSETITHMSRMIEEGVDLMTKTLKSFRSFVRRGSKIEHFELNSAIESLLFLFQKIFEKENIQITFERSPNEIYIRGSAVELKQVFLSLLTNSRDAIRGQQVSSPAGCGHIHICVNACDDGVVVRYEDDGGGIPEALLPQIFEMGFSTKGDQGSGIGLGISHRIIEHMRGSIVVQNSSDGAMFTITLPSEEG